MRTNPPKTPPARINLALPAELLKELRETIPPRQRNQFIVELIERELRRLRFLKAWEEAAGAWSDEDHPDLMTREDVDRYVRRLRETWMPRSWDEIVGETEEDERVSTGHEHPDLAITA
jgi:hypothetical protein